MFILQGSCPLGSGPTGPGSGYSVMPFESYISKELISITFKFILSNERKPSGDSRKAVHSIAAKSLDRAICTHFSYDRLDTVASSIP